MGKSNPKALVCPHSTLSVSGTKVWEIASFDSILQGCLSGSLLPHSSAVLYPVDGMSCPAT